VIDKREPQFAVLAGDVMDGLRLGAAVQEGEYDAEVRCHPWLKPGEAFLINRAALRDLVITPPRVL
jgi:hypothetical protein